MDSGPCHYIFHSAFCCSTLMSRALDVKGVARVLAKERPTTKIVVCEPELSPMLTSGQPQERMEDGSPSKPHPVAQPHPLQGWSPPFLPKLTGDVVEMGVISEVLKVSGPDAIRTSLDLARKEGIFVGLTSGATMAGALRVCQAAPKGSTVLCMLPDTGERYLSTPLFADVKPDMNDEEWAISRSSPSAQFEPKA